jgi:cell division protein FtsL
MKRTGLALLLIFVLTAFSAAADSYRQGKILKWENSTYAAKKKQARNWVVYQLETDTGTYSIARQKESKPEMQAGEIVQYELKGQNEIKVIDANGRKREYRIVGESAAPAR